MWRDDKERKKDRDGFTTNRKFCLGDDPKFHMVHVPLTLDEYCCPALSNEILNRRNQDQVLGRYFEQKEIESHRPLIAVGQVWLWKAQNILIATDVPDTLTSAPKFQSPISRTGASLDSLIKIAEFLADRIEILDSPSLFRPPVLDIFERSITKITVYVDQYAEDIRVDTMNIVKERKYLHGISDIREELAMIRRILFQQEEVWRDFASYAWPENWRSCHDGKAMYPHGFQDRTRQEQQEYREVTALIMRPISQLEKFHRRIQQLDEDAERVEKSVNTQLELKQKFASLSESHATAVMSAAVFGFTIITIIFTPLSFVMSLFALPIDQFQRHQVNATLGGGGMYRKNYIGRWAGV
jgi:hypothetical protein